MYCVMRCWPTSPSFWSFSSDGTTTVSSCRMIDAVMYGMIPSANSAIRDSPPPLKRFRKPRMLEPPNCSWTALTASTLMPGTGMWAPRRYSARMNAVKASFLRISATVKA